MTQPAIPFIPDSAPFSTEQRAWLNGYLAAMFSLLTGNNATTQATPPITLSIVFGSQSGNGEAIAKRAAKEAKKRGCDAKVIDAAQFDMAALRKTERLLLITSTYGEGEPPDNIAAFYNELHANDADLGKLSYAVLALGDRNYVHFCKVGKDFDVRLAMRGACRLWSSAM